MKNFALILLPLVLVLISCKNEESVLQDIEQPSSIQGYNMLLIGNSFFRPYAEHLGAVVEDAGIENHNTNLVFRGGENGRPINFWNDTTSDAHQEIKEILDQGGIEVFGMTAGLLPDNPIDGFKEWIAYALQNNPDITIFLSIPPVDFPADWDQRAEDNGFDSIEELYEYFINETVHQTLVDPLRAEFPSTTIFTIPTGWAAFNLAQMQEDNELEDEITLFGPKPTSIFTDPKGHQGQIVIEAGTLLWLNAIYNVDLDTNTYQTGFNTNLHELAKQIMENHDNAYKQ